jgi:hypothetical protein
MTVLERLKQRLGEIEEEIKTEEGRVRSILIRISHLKDDMHWTRVAIAEEVGQPTQ